MGNQSVRAPELSFGISVVDSGTTFLIVPGDIFNQIVNVFQSQFCDIPHICGPKNIFEGGSCLNTTQYFNVLPDITFFFEGVRVSLRPEDYMEKYILGNHTLYCFGIASAGNSSLTILGDTFMKGPNTLYQLIQFSCIYYF